MLPTHQFVVDRMKACVSDMCENGINLRDASERELRRTVREHLEYFQLMLGYDSDPAEVLELLKERIRKIKPA